MPYVIESRRQIFNKESGKWDREMISYFQKNSIVRTGGPFWFNVVVGTTAEAKQYDFKTEANRDKRKYYGNKKGVKVIKI